MICAHHCEISSIFCFGMLLANKEAGFSVGRESGPDSCQNKAHVHFLTEQRISTF